MKNGLGVNEANESEVSSSLGITTCHYYFFVDDIFFILKNVGGQCHVRNSCSLKSVSFPNWVPTL